MAPIISIRQLEEVETLPIDAWLRAHALDLRCATHIHAQINAVFWY